MCYLCPWFIPIKGIGEKSAAYLIAELPDLTLLRNARQLAFLLEVFGEGFADHKGASMVAGLRPCL